MIVEINTSATMHVFDPNMSEEEHQNIEGMEIQVKTDEELSLEELFTERESDLPKMKVGDNSVPIIIRMHIKDLQYHELTYPDGEKVTLVSTADGDRVAVQCDIVTFEQDLFKKVKEYILKYKPTPLQLDWFNYLKEKHG